MNYNVQTRNSTLGCHFVPNKKTTTYGLRSISQQAIYNWNKVTKSAQTDLSNCSRFEVKRTTVKLIVENY